MLKDKLGPLAGFVYGAAAVITFGYAANNSKAEQRADFEECMTREDKYFACTGIDDSVLVGGFSAMLWPLYWSWEFFDVEA